MQLTSEAVHEDAHLRAGVGSSRPSPERPGTILMIAYLFPPAGGPAIPAVLRMVKFVRTMAGSRWRPVVLTLDGDLFETYFHREERWLREIPSSVPVARASRVRMLKRIIAVAQRVRAAVKGPGNAQVSATPETVEQPSPARADQGLGQRLKNAITTAAQIPDPYIGWLPYAFAQGLKIIRKEQVSCIYATGSPWSTVVLAAVLQRLTRRPLVLDFRDPWTTNPYRAHFQPWRRAIEEKLEAFAIESASMVVANTQALRDELRARFPERADRFVSVYNSVDATITEGPERPIGQRPVTIVHAGFLYGPRDPLTLFQAISRRSKGMGDTGADFELHLVGPTELPYDLRHKLDELRIADFVKIHGPVSHSACKDIMADADALLLFQPGTRTQLPSKVFEYVTFAKPILTLAEPDGETYRFAAEELESTVAACGDEEAIVAALDRLLAQLRRGDRPNVSRWSARLAAFSEPAVTEQLLEAIDRAVTGDSDDARAAHNR